MKKKGLRRFVPLSTALLAALSLLSLVMGYVKYNALDKVYPTMGKSGVVVNTDEHLSYSNVMVKALSKTIQMSSVLYTIAMIFALIVIVIAILNFLGIGGKNVGYAFVGATVVSFLLALIATIILYKSEGSIIVTKITPSLAPWWATITLFLAAVSTANVFIKKK